MSKTKGNFVKTKGSFAKKSSRKQKIYKMVGCSKKTRKNHLGGSTDTPLAYTGEPSFSYPNPYLAYTGKGGSSCGLTVNTSIPTNTNAANPALPNTGPVSDGNNTIFNSALGQTGGCCGSCGSTSQMMGGGRRKRGGMCPACSLGLMAGGSNHRKGCKCSSCKVMKGGNAGIPYPNGLVGTSWTPSIGTWPGVNGVPGDSNYYQVNKYDNDVSRQMVDVGANPPFLYMKGGKKRKQTGGTLSNFLTQDLINLGRQFQFGMGSAYNALAGYSAPVNPMPWKDQFPSRVPFNPATI
jgi:hypothetical protein